MLLNIFWTFNLHSKLQQSAKTPQSMRLWPSNPFVSDAKKISTSSTRYRGQPSCYNPIINQGWKVLNTPNYSFPRPITSTIPLFRVQTFKERNGDWMERLTLHQDLEASRISDLMVLKMTRFNTSSGSLNLRGPVGCTWSPVYLAHHLMYNNNIAFKFYLLTYSHFVQFTIGYRALSGPQSPECWLALLIFIQSSKWPRKLNRLTYFMCTHLV